MNVDLRLEYRHKTKSKGSLSDAEYKDKYLVWIEDELTKEREEVKKFNISGVGVTLPNKLKIWSMAAVIVDKQKKVRSLPDKETIDWEDLTEDWFDWLDNEIKGN